MIYFDAAYIAKCYLNEPGAEVVRALAHTADGLGSCEFARIEFAAIITRHRRERQLTRREATAVLREFHTDEQSGVWQWFPVTPELIERAREAVLRMPEDLFLRSAAALHLACARDQGFAEVYTNDRHMLAAARHFDLRGTNVITTGPHP